MRTIELLGKEVLPQIKNYQPKPFAPIVQPVG
jgi:hypothetical protein